MQDGFNGNAVLIFGSPRGVNVVSGQLVLRRRGIRGTRFRPRRWVPRDWFSYLVRVGPFVWRVVCKRGFGHTLWEWDYEGVRFPLYPSLTWYGELLFMKKRTPKPAAESPPHLAPVESNVLAKCMALVEHCAATKYDDGEPRQPGWFTIRTRGSAWEVEIKDPDTCSRLVVIQGTLDDALALATCLLDAEEAPWEPDQWLLKAKQQKGKK